MNEAELAFEKQDTSNQFGVGVAGNGELRIHWQPTEAPIRLSREQALNLGAWLLVLADPEGKKSERLMKQIRST
jgi:hypothetical protein